jgi:hypothetical protein
MPLPRSIVLLALLAILAGGEVATAVTLPSGFQQSTVWSGLDAPTAIQFARAPDTRIFVAEKSGIIKVFDNLSDQTPAIFADLRTVTHNYWDRGLLGIALHPDFPTTPYVYVIYTYDHMPGAPANAVPAWGVPGATNDNCPDPPGGTDDGCVVTGRVSRLTLSSLVPNTMEPGSEQVFIENYCQQYPSHSIGTIAFGGDGALYVSGGDGASFNFGDYGQNGYPPDTNRNPCGDPPVGVGGIQEVPSAEGGSLRSLDILTSGDPQSYDGTVIRLDAITGAAMPDNPLAGGDVTDDDPIIAYGPPQSVPHGAAPGHERDLARRRRRRVVGRDRSHRQYRRHVGRELRLALLRGHRQRRTRRARARHVRRSLRVAGRRHRPVLTRTRTARGSCPTRRAVPAARRSPA